jgi:5-methylcytosine-specific restriction endonuclease McrA
MPTPKQIADRNARAMHEMYKRTSAADQRLVLNNGTKRTKKKKPLSQSASYWQRRAETAEKALRMIAGAPKPASGPTFYESQEWRVLRYKALKLHGAKCQLCGCSDGQMQVDHIKPRSKYPELELRLDNLQVLCRDCNLGKGAWDESDWRKGALKSIPGT